MFFLNTTELLPHHQRPYLTYLVFHCHLYAIPTCSQFFFMCNISNAVWTCSHSHGHPSFHSFFILPLIMVHVRLLWRWLLGLWHVDVIDSDCEVAGWSKQYRARLWRSTSITQSTGGIRGKKFRFGIVLMWKKKCRIGQTELVGQAIQSPVQWRWESRNNSVWEKMGGGGGMCEMGR